MTDFRKGQPAILQPLRKQAHGQAPGTKNARRLDQVTVERLNLSTDSLV